MISKSKFWLKGLLLFSLGLLANPPATHGMVVFGDDDVYFHHLPMYHAPHNYQAIFRVDLDRDGQAVYEAVKGHFEKQGEVALFTFFPKQFLLTDLIDRPGGIIGSLYLGHFEQDGRELIQDVTAQVLQVMYAEEMPHSDDMSNIPMEYLMLGTPKAQYMIHLIRNGAPNYDHIVQIKPGSHVHPGKVRSVFFPYGEDLWPEQKYQKPPISTGMVTDQEAEEDFKIEKVRDIYFGLDDLKH